MNKFAAACFGVMVLAICLRTQVDSQNTTAATPAATPAANQTTASTSVNVTTMATNTFSSAANVTTPSRADPALQPAIYFILIAMATSLLQCC
ncbi:hypothetical protein ANANG_G00123270 [Anguilla anguilla]|uniref:Uncharacterized protein n=1 Tax=Anguilla anguilla TaxID=7936 RepID=A0A9D3MJB8_ANGAN|nr:hypothetical protein ANANG_G00123270 [Anguilla anguilla]